MSDTKRKMAQALKELMAEKPLKRITIRYCGEKPHDAPELLLPFSGYLRGAGAYLPIRSGGSDRLPGGGELFPLDGAPDGDCGDE